MTLVVVFIHGYDIFSGCILYIFVFKDMSYCRNDNCVHDSKLHQGLQALSSKLHSIDVFASAFWYSSSLDEVSDREVMGGERAGPPDVREAAAAATAAI